MTAPSFLSARRRRFLAALLTGYLLALSLIALWPSPVDQGVSSLIARVLAAMHRRGVPSWFDYSLIESGANVLLFIPFGILVAAVLPLQHKWLALFAGAGASVLFETGQEYLRPERYATMQDVLANTLGTAIGTITVYALAHRRVKETGDAELGS